MTTLETIRELAQLEDLTVLETITLLQTGAAKINDEAALEALCDIKSELLGLA